MTQKNYAVPFRVGGFQYGTKKLYRVIHSFGGFWKPQRNYTVSFTVGGFQYGTTKLYRVIHSCRLLVWHNEIIPCHSQLEAFSMAQRNYSVSFTVGGF